MRPQAVPQLGDSRSCDQVSPSMTEFSSRGHTFHEQVQHRQEAFLVLPAFNICCEHSKVRPEVCPDRFRGSGEIISANGADDRAGPCSSTPHGPNAECDCRPRPGGRAEREEKNLSNSQISDTACNHRATPNWHPATGRWKPTWLPHRSFSAYKRRAVAKCHSYAAGRCRTRRNPSDFAGAASSSSAPSTPCAVNIYDDAAPRRSAHSITDGNGSFGSDSSSRHASRESR